MMDSSVTNVISKGSLRPTSDVVAATTAEIRAALRSMVASGVLEITLDFSHVKMLDSAGLGLLVAAHNSLSKLGGRLAITQASPDVLDLLQTMRIHQHLSVSGNLLSQP
jgi:anti-anti-sigma factor